MRASNSITKALGVADKGELQVLYGGKTIEKGAHVGRAGKHPSPPRGIGWFIDMASQTPNPPLSWSSQQQTHPKPTL